MVPRMPNLALNLNTKKNHQIFNWSLPIYFPFPWINLHASRALLTAAQGNNPSQVLWRLVSLGNHLGNTVSHTFYAIPWALLSVPLRQWFSNLNKQNHHMESLRKQFPGARFGFRRLEWGPHQATAPPRTATALGERGSTLNMQKPPTPSGKMTVLTATSYTPLRENTFASVIH